MGFIFLGLLVFFDAIIVVSSFVSLSSLLHVPSITKNRYDHDSDLHLMITPSRRTTKKIFVSRNDNDNNKPFFVTVDDDANADDNLEKNNDDRRRITITKKQQIIKKKNIDVNINKHKNKKAVSTSNNNMFNGGKAGSGADDAYIWDDATMSGPLGPFVDSIFMNRFRTALATSNLKYSSDYRPGYDGMMDIIKEMMETSLDADYIVAKSRATLNSLFPDWPPNFWNDRVGLLFWFEILFAKPFPVFSCKMNAWVTWWAAQWLMGPCEIQDLNLKIEEEEGTTTPTIDERNKESSTENTKIIAGGNEEDNNDLLDDHIPTMIGDGKGQLVLVRRCRYLEAGSCASLCVNSCKLPTQQFFNEDMAIPMRMIPDYNTYECRFEFGVAPTEQDEEEARNVSCFSQCTSKKKRINGEAMDMISCGTTSTSGTSKK